MSSKNMNVKEEIRDQVKSRRRSLSEDEVAQFSQVIQNKALELPLLKHASIVGCYLSTPREVQTSLLIETLWSRRQRVCVPAYAPEEAGYQWCWYTSTTDLEAGLHGIPQPIDPVWLGDHSPEAILVPGLAYDTEGHRLGHGGGFFDRLLTTSASTVIGLSFDTQLVQEVPIEDHDVHMDAILTEGRDFAFRQGIL